MATIKVRIPAQTVTVDVDAWVDEFGVEPSLVRDDVRQYFETHMYGAYPFSAGLAQ